MSIERSCPFFLGGGQKSEGIKLGESLSGFTHSDSDATSFKPVVTSRNIQFADVTTPIIIEGMTAGHEEAGKGIGAVA